jgi:hypothetical protein
VLSGESSRRKRLVAFYCSGKFYRQCLLTNNSRDNKLSGSYWFACRDCHKWHELAESVRASQRDRWHYDSNPKLSRFYWHLLVVSLLADASLENQVGSQREANQFIKKNMLKFNVLDLATIFINITYLLITFLHFLYFLLYPFACRVRCNFPVFAILAAFRFDCH